MTDEEYIESMKGLTACYQKKFPNRWKRYCELYKNEAVRISNFIDVCSEAECDDRNTSDELIIHPEECGGMYDTKGNRKQAKPFVATYN